MLRYLIKRMLFAPAILITVHLLTFLLFFSVNTPSDIARMQLGAKYATPEAISQWKQAHDYHWPLLYNTKASGLDALTQTLLYKKTQKAATFSFGTSIRGRLIGEDIQTRMWPSLALALPTLILSLACYLLSAMLLVLIRYSIWETIGLSLSVVLMSISSLFFIIAGQYLIAIYANLTPISGYLPGTAGLKFLLLPVGIAVFSGLGAGARWYRTLLLEEADKPYVRTARAKGVGPWRILTHHLLPNAMIPIATGVVAHIPLLFLGSLLLESFFGIPGLGSYTLEAIMDQDFEVLQVIIELGTLFYLLGLILTDIAYTFLDPRIRFDDGQNV